MKVTGPVLVTGATGFLGSYVVRALLERGVPVRAIGRNLEAGLALEALGAEFRPVDLRQRAAVVAVCRGVQAVVHSGARVDAFGRRSDFQAVNVGGTENVIAGCRAHGVARLVHISTPSVVRRGAAPLPIDERVPASEDHTSPYPWSKKLAEDRVRAAAAGGMATVILRPRAIYGPGDRALLPRVVEPARKGRLAIIGDGDNLANFTFVEDAARAVLLALARDEAVSGTYFVTSGEDLPLWDVLFRLLDRMGVPRPTRRVTIEQAMAAAAVMEAAWSLLPLPGDPLLTRYTVDLMAHSWTFDISAARADLGYAPQVTIDEGIERTAAAWGQGALDGVKAKRRRRPKPKAVAAFAKREVLNAGWCGTQAAAVEPGGTWREVELPALFALLHHEREGVVLFDTGYSRRFEEATRTWPYQLYRWLTPVRVAPEDEAVAQLAARGVAPEDVRWVVVSHFDPDHIGGVADFPNAQFLCSWRAWQAVGGKTGLAALRERYMPNHVPPDFTARLRVLRDPDGPPIGPFPASHDVFADGSLRLVELPGHAAGQLGAFVRGAGGPDWFLAADGCWSRAAEPPPIPVHRLIARDRRQQDETYGRLAQLAQDDPDIVIIPAHCRAAASELLPDLQ